MNWLTKITPPGMSKIFSKRDTPDNLWVKCPKTGEMVFHKDLEAGLFVTPGGHHMRIGPSWRFQFTFDGEFKELDTPEVPRDPLKFKDDKPYTSRIQAARKKTGRDDAMAIAVGQIGGLESVVLVQNFAFMGGSLGMAAGESFLKAAEALINRLDGNFCSIQDTGMADHITIGVIRHNEIICPRRNSRDKFIGHLRRRHLWLQVVGRYFRGWHKDSIFALEFSFTPSIQEECDVGILLRLCNAKLCQASVGNYLAQNILQSQRRKQDVEEPV